MLLIFKFFIPITTVSIDDQDRGVWRMIVTLFSKTKYIDFHLQTINLIFYLFVLE